MGLRLSDEDCEIIKRYAILYLRSRERKIQNRIPIYMYVSGKLKSPRITTRRARWLIGSILYNLRFAVIEHAIPVPADRRYITAREAAKYSKRIIASILNKREKLGEKRKLPLGSARAFLPPEKQELVINDVVYCTEAMIGQLKRFGRISKHRYKITMAETILLILSTMIHERTHILQIDNQEAYNDSLDYYQRLGEHEAILMFAEYLFIFSIVKESTEAMRIWDMRHMFTCKMYWNLRIHDDKFSKGPRLNELFPRYWIAYCQSQNVPCTITNIEKFTREYKDSKELTAFLNSINYLFFFHKRKKKKK